MKLKTYQPKATAYTRLKKLFIICIRSDFEKDSIGYILFILYSVVYLLPYTVKLPLNYLTGCFSYTATLQ